MDPAGIGADVIAGHDVVIGGRPGDLDSAPIVAGYHVPFAGEIAADCIVRRAELDLNPVTAIGRIGADEVARDQIVARLNIDAIVAIPTGAESANDEPANRAPARRGRDRQTPCESGAHAA